MTIFRYIILFGCCLGLDRWSKWWALVNDVDLQASPFLNFSLIWNRGVSWGIFNEASSYGFYVLTAFIVLVTIGLAYHAFYLEWYKRRANIFWEIFVLAGSVSNLIDRFVFGGVIDFIQLHMGLWYWPTFNIADAFIVVGVIGLMFKNMKGSHEDKN